MFSYLPTILKRFVLLAAAMLLLVAVALAQNTPRLKTAFGPDGLSSLNYQGAELLLNGQASISASVLTADGKSGNLNLQGLQKTVTGGKVIYRYPELTVTSVMTQQADTLRMVFTFSNTGQQTINHISVRPFTLQFPRRPQGGAWAWGYQVSTTNKGVPGIVEANYGAGKVVACVDEIEKPVIFGFEGNYGNSSSNNLLIETDKADLLKPGETKTLKFSLRFAPGATPTITIASDLYAQFAKAYPYKLAWTDRRPIGALMMCNSAMHWPTNPRGWFNDPTVDITTDAGRQDFHKRLMQYADGCISVIKETGGQGMILWDVEGEEMPHAITYLGDPRILPKTAPEMDAYADEFFKKFRDAGLKVGVCIRPSRIIPNPKGGWMHQQAEDHVAELADKIAYAKKRWGCTIFYMDTNVKWPMNTDATKGMWQGDAELLTAKDLYELTRRHPDVLIFPEFGTFGYWSSCMPYGEIRGGSTHTSEIIRAVYPKAGTTISAGDGDYYGLYNELLPGALGGDIHLFRGWFGDSMNTKVKHLYQEVAYLHDAAQAPLKGMTLANALKDSRPLIRYEALLQVKPTDANAISTILSAAPTEKDWVVLRKMVTLLGASKNAAAVPLLAELLKDNSKDMDSFAAQALGQLGSVSTAILLPLVTDKDTRIAQRALQALTSYADEQALPTIITLTDSTDPQVRLQAISALGAYHTDAAVEKLLTLLTSDDPAQLIATCNALGRTKDRRAIAPLVKTIERSVAKPISDNNVRSAAGDALEAITGKQFGPFEQNWRRAFDAGTL